MPSRQLYLHVRDMLHWLIGRYTKRTTAFGSLDFFGGDKPNDLTCPTCPERETCTEVSYSNRIQCCFRREVDVEDNQMMIMELDGGMPVDVPPPPTWLG